MDASLYRRYRQGVAPKGSLTRNSPKAESWDNAPAPAQVAKKPLGREVPPGYARFLNNGTHWGMGMGAAYGLLIGSRKSKLWYGIPFGAAVWAGGYVVLPRLGVHKEIWKYDVETLGQDVGAHLVFGSATAGAFALLSQHHKTTGTKTRKGLA